MKTTTFTILIFFSLTISKIAGAQSFYSLRTDRSLIAVVGLNSSTYYGDLKDDSDILDAKPSLSVGLTTGVSRKLYLRSEFSWITLSGRDIEADDKYRSRRNLSFTSNNYELSISGVFNIVPHRGRFYQRPNANFYGFIGIGALYFNPQAELEGKLYALQPLQTEGLKYSRFTVVVPFGIGGKIKLTPFSNLSLEAGWRKSFTDYIDDVSTVHVDNASFTNPVARQLADRRPEVGHPVVPAGTRRGNSDRYDGYMLLTAKVEYYLPIQLGSSQKLYRLKRNPYYR
jgi:hypothetical protein